MTRASVLELDLRSHCDRGCWATPIGHWMKQRSRSRCIRGCSLGDTFSILPPNQVMCVSFFFLLYTLSFSPRSFDRNSNWSNKWTNRPILHSMLHWKCNGKKNNGHRQNGCPDGRSHRLKFGTNASNFSWPNGSIARWICLQLPLSPLLSILLSHLTSLSYSLTHSFPRYFLLCVTFDFLSTHDVFTVRLWLQ